MRHVKPPLPSSSSSSSFTPCDIILRRTCECVLRCLLLPFPLRKPSSAPSSPSRPRISTLVYAHAADTARLNAYSPTHRRHPSGKKRLCGTFSLRAGTSRLGGAQWQCLRNESGVRFHSGSTRVSTISGRHRVSAQNRNGIYWTRVNGQIR